MILPELEEFSPNLSERGTLINHHYFLLGGEIRRKYPSNQVVVYIIKL